MNTRWHRDDLAGRILDHAEQTGEKWDILSLPCFAEDGDQMGRSLGEVLWPQRWPAETMRRVQETKTPYWWGAMYQQRPGQYGEAAWPDEWFSDIWADRWPEKWKARAIAIDPSKGKDAQRGDYTGMVFVGLADGLIWVDANIQRMPPPQIVETGLDWWEARKPDIFGVEANQFQELLAADFQRRALQRGDFDFAVMPIENTINKQLRIIVDTN